MATEQPPPPPVEEEEKEFISNVRFEPVERSPYISPTRMHFTRRGRDHYWDMALTHDSVTVLLYHTEKRSLLLVRQFRPTVFVETVRALPENANKLLSEINWPRYPISLGMTLESCGGIMDKADKSPEQTVHEEVEEECGYRVNHTTLIKKYRSGVGISGGCHYLFFAEVDESMRCSEGGGVASEGEIIENAFISVEEARRLLDAEEVNFGAGILFSMAWFFDKQYHKYNNQS